MRELTMDEVRQVSGGEWVDDFEITVTADVDRMGDFLKGLDWQTAANTLNTSGNALSRFGNLLAGATLITGVAAAAQGGLDIPNDGAVVFLGAGAALSTSLAEVFHIGADIATYAAQP